MVKRRQNRQALPYKGGDAGDIRDEDRAWRGRDHEDPEVGFHENADQRHRSQSRDFGGEAGRRSHDALEE